MGSKQRLETDEDSSMKWKTQLVCNLEKRNVLRLDLNESREGFKIQGSIEALEKSLI